MSHTKLDPEVFREAAKLLVARHYDHCCSAIRHASYTGCYDSLLRHERSTAHINFLGKCYRPANKNYGESWWSSGFGEHAAMPLSEPRVLALLLCAEMLENP